MEPRLLAPGEGHALRRAALARVMPHHLPDGGTHSLDKGQHGLVGRVHGRCDGASQRKRNTTCSVDSFTPPTLNLGEHAMRSRAETDCQAYRCPQSV